MILKHNFQQLQFFTEKKMSSDEDQDSDFLEYFDYGSDNDEKSINEAETDSESTSKEDDGNSNGNEEEEEEEEEENPRHFVRNRGNASCPNVSRPNASRSSQTENKTVLAAISQHQKNPVNRDNDCSICLEAMDDPKTLCFCSKTCGNCFHSECIRRYSNNAHTNFVKCPMCRTYGTMSAIPPGIISANRADLCCF
jgi:hypothetical protein